MPPSKHSGSSMSAHKDSDQIPTDQNYTLGDYSFRIERTSVPGSSNDKIDAICTKDGKNARKSIQVPSSTRMIGWYVEANADSADVYVSLEVPSGGTEHETTLDISPMISPIPVCEFIALTKDSGYSPGGFVEYSGLSMCGVYETIPYSYPQQWLVIVASGSPNAILHYHVKNGNNEYSGDFSLDNSITINGKTVYYDSLSPGHGYSAESCLTSGVYQSVPRMDASHVENVAWAMVYGDVVPSEYKKEEKLIGRFAIELEDAGGVGPQSDWNDPGDYDDGWEPGDPTHTLYVEVTGALSGRHNDPIVDPSYSYIPADKDTVKDYGCGGDGGHGGGGGAGASTVVVHKFATNQANSKEVTAIARRHGYGSGGGKGGKGGDGCILVYY